MDLPLRKIDINNGAKAIDARDGDLLIDVLASNGIHLPSACGSSGKCGLCKVTVINYTNEPDFSEYQLLNRKEISDGLRLSCQIRVNEDLRIDLPKEYLGAREYTATLRSKKLLTPDIMEVTLDLVSPEEMSFLPGQYITFKCPSYEDKKAVMRPFSIASSVYSKKAFQLNVRLNPQGTCTPWIFNHFEPGQKVSFSGPRGNFYLRNTMRPILLIAGGSGMAPVRAILKSIAESKTDRPVIFFFGALTENGLFYLNEMREFEQSINKFRFYPALSGEPDNNDWAGERGLISDVVERVISWDASDCEAYLCGRPAMIECCVPILDKLGIPRERIFFDLFNSPKQK